LFICGFFEMKEYSFRGVRVVYSSYSVIGKSGIVSFVRNCNPNLAPNRGIYFGFV